MMNTMRDLKLPATEIVTLAGRDIKLKIQRHAKARRISLRIASGQNGIVMTLPRRASVETGMKFFHKKADWVLANVKQGAEISLIDGTQIPVLGELLTIIHKPGRGLTAREGKKLQVHGAAEFTPRRVRDYLKKLVRDAAAEEAQAMVKQLGKTVSNVTVREMHSRWGSCTASGRLAFSWRLVFAPREVLTYLIAHEVAHLVQMDHSDKFWKVVKDLCPDYLQQRKWLRQHGHELYAYS